MRRFLERLFDFKKKKTIQRDFEWEKFQVVAKEQFKRLKEKGISIPVVSL